jgi:hypothetical protein
LEQSLWAPTLKLILSLGSLLSKSEAASFPWCGFYLSFLAEGIEKLSSSNLVFSLKPSWREDLPMDFMVAYELRMS